MKSADDVFNELSAENFALKRMLSILFEFSPGALAKLQGMDPDKTRDWLESKPLNDAFISRVLETLEVVKRNAHPGSSASR